MHLSVPVNRPVKTELKMQQKKLAATELQPRQPGRPRKTLLHQLNRTAQRQVHTECLHRTPQITYAAETPTCYLFGPSAGLHRHRLLTPLYNDTSKHKSLRFLDPITHAVNSRFYA